ncbi:hypothetical protein NPIL_319111, partial [Nephila pilipes]
MAKWNVGCEFELCLSRRLSCGIMEQLH